MLRNIKAIVKRVQSLCAALTTTATGVALNTAEFVSVAFNFNIGTQALTGVNFLTLQLEDSDDGVTYALCTVANGGLYSADPVLNATGMDAQTYMVEYRGNKKFVRPKILVAGTISTTAAITAMGLPKHMPPSGN